MHVCLIKIQPFRAVGGDEVCVACPEALRPARAQGVLLAKWRESNDHQSSGMNVLVDSLYVEGTL